MGTAGRTPAVAAVLTIVLIAGSFLLLAQVEGVGKVGRDIPGQDDQIKRGRYLVRITGCNDCHTEGYAEAGGEIPEETWLKGSALGWRGPWGTTYGTNLRLYFARISEDDWVEIARELETRPPMPWFGVRGMTDQDLRAMYRFIRHLGEDGAPEPAYVPPDKEPNPPYVLFP